MTRLAWLLLLACATGCAAAPKPEPVMAEPLPTQDIPLLAPDETEAAAHPRLTEAKRIANEGAVDGPRRAGAQGTTRTTSSAATRTTVPRGYGRAYRYSSASNSSAGTFAPNFPGGSTTPPVAGNYPTVPSYGGTAR